MYGITDNARLEFLKIMINQQTEDTSSSILPNPIFKESKESNFLVGLTGYSIIKVLSNKNQILVFANDETKSIIRIFDTSFTLIKDIDKWYDIDNIEQDLYKFIDIKIDDFGNIYGFIDKDDKTNFFIFNNFLDFISGLDEETLKQEIFYSTIFDIETEIVKENEVKIGNSLFSQLRNSNPNNIKYGFNEDAIEKLKFGFVIEDFNTKKVSFIQFITDIGQATSEEASWEYNEILKLGGIEQTFDGLSQLDILTGDKNDGKNTTKGSIILSTQKDAANNVEVPFDLNIDVDASTRNGFFEDFVIDNYFSKPKNIDLETSSEKILLNDNELKESVKPIISIINSNPTTLAYTGYFNFNSNFDENGKSSYFIDQDLINRIINEPCKLVVQSSIQKTNSNQDFNYSIKFYLIFNNSEKYFLNTASDNSFVRYNDFIRFAVLPVSSTKKLNKFEVRYITPIDQLGTYKSNYSFSIKINFNANGSRTQQTIQQNSTSQILIENIDDEINYEIIQAANNSYEATKSAFLSSTKFYIPLKEKNSNQYSIFEFTGIRNQAGQLSNTFFNDIGDKSYSDVGGDSYKRILIEPQSITRVLVNQIEKPSNEYSLTGDTITILGIIKNDIIEIEYKSLIGSPKKINVESSTQGQDIFIQSIDDFVELGSSVRSIVGVGDDSFEGLQSQCFGFNLYRSKANIDFDKIAESTTEISDIKMKHIVSYRQKNILFINGFNEDYSKVVSWVQIYPDSFHPYTYLPYSNPANYFHLERLNINKDRDLKYSNFDREFLDIGSSGNTILANTIATLTDINFKDSNNVDVFGATNQKIFEFPEIITKENNENLSLNVQLDISVIDNLYNLNKTIDGVGDKMIKLFKEKSYDHWRDFQIRNIIITYDDNSTLETSALDYITLNENLKILEFKISLLNESGKRPIKLQVDLADGSIIADVDLTIDECLDGLTNINFDVVLKDNFDQFPYVFYNKTPYNRPYEPIPINIKKGGANG